MGSLRQRIEQVVGYRVARAPDLLVSLTTARRPIVIDGHALEPRTQHAVRLIEAGERVPLWRLPVAEARVQYGRMSVVFEDPPRVLARVEDRRIPGPRRELGVRIYRPRFGRPPGPALVFFHGGGGVIGNLDTHDRLCRILAAAIDEPVISVDYALAPEEPFPAAPEDALAAFRWVVQHAEELAIDPERVAVGGDSMGGNLAAVVCQQVRELGPERPCAQLLIYPGTDRVAATRSRELFAEGLVLTEDMLRWFVELYLGDGDPADPRVSPLRHPRLADLPPAIVITAGFDPLRDEGHAYAQALREAGVQVHERCEEGLVHGFAQMTGAVPAAHEAVLAAAAELRAIFDASC